MRGGIQFAKIKVSICHGERSPNDPAWRGRGEGESNHPENVSIAHAASGNSPRLFPSMPMRLQDNKLQRKMFLRELPAAAWAAIYPRDASTCAYPGFLPQFAQQRRDLGDPVRRDSRVAQHDRSEFFRPNCYPATSDRGAALAAARITPAKNNVSAK